MLSRPSVPVKARLSTTPGPGSLPLPWPERVQEGTKAQRHRAQETKRALCYAQSQTQLTPILKLNSHCWKLEILEL